MATHVLTIPDWRPVSLNRLLGCHWGTRSRLKRRDRDLVAAYALALGIPRAQGRRRVTVRVEARGTPPDPDAALKSLLDALVACGLLIDDSGEWCELGTPTAVRGREDRTVVTLEDLL